MKYIVLTLSILLVCAGGVIAYQHGVIGGQRKAIVEAEFEMSKLTHNTDGMFNALDRMMK